MSQWFAGKKHEEQVHLLNVASSKANKLREQHKREQNDVIAQNKARLLENKQKQEEKRQKQIYEKQRIAHLVKEHGGPCTSTCEVDDLVNSVPNKAKKLELVKNEIRYQKLVIGRRGPLLRLTGTLEELVINLKEFFGDDAGVMTEYLDPDGGTESTSTGFTRTRKRRRLESISYSTLQIDFESDDMESDFSEESNQEESFESDSESLLQNINKFGTFRFTEQGVFIAVYFDDDFYLGEVTEIVSPLEAKVVYMEKAGQGKKTYFKWGRRTVEHTDCQYVFAWDLEVKTETGRRWNVSNLDELYVLYLKYKSIFC